LENCDFRIQGKSAILAFSASQQFSIDAINREENRSFIEGIIEKILGKKMKIRCCLLDEMMTDEKKYGEKITRTDNEEIVEKAIDIFGSDFVEVVDD